MIPEIVDLMPDFKKADHSIVSRFVRSIPATTKLKTEAPLEAKVRPVGPNE